MSEKIISEVKSIASSIDLEEIKYSASVNFDKRQSVFTVTDDPSPLMKDLLANPESFSSSSSSCTSLLRLKSSTPEVRKSFEITNSLSCPNRRSSHNSHAIKAVKRHSLFKQMETATEDYFMIKNGKPGWICVQCSNFNFESRKINRQKEMQQVR